MCPLRRLLLLSLESLLAIAPYHNNRKEAAYDGAEEDDENDRYTDSPHARREE
jgi:hypothetical protein